MQLVTFEHQGKMKLGVKFGEFLIDLGAAAKTFAHSMTEQEITAYAAIVAGDMVGLLQVQEEGIAFVQKLVDAVRTAQLPPLNEILLAQPTVHLKAPLLRPGKIICVGKNYIDHATEMNSEPPTIPILFAKFANVINDPGAPFTKPLQSYQVDYEAELAVIIGKTAKFVKREDAFTYIAGYSCFNDLSIRDFQRRTSQWLQGKTFDGSGPLGPSLVTRDEITDPQNLTIRCFVNEEIRQQANTAEMIFDIPFLLEYISSIMTLEPGDVIATGTPSGVAAGMQEPRYLRAGDEVIVEIERLGQLRTEIV
ncbi:fumarylacetoacetate hydrolase family protein [Sulfoacidibacillus thermotolerans]|uniref:Fumarylacetoacetase-like C-terminal domain-containing protein n=1 Tax=Sulfoacidibacillus thermotolerans TaxID=1765684 RepID=A0A2U3DAU5_SULT2|nr:fumarylacetoacetate hydrolase family protein [Sulfoacidibacillus thermotolerans]PWI58399.1 hypothetical protein BM613_04085 [Sulfoacidibacillus thermotolerans]